MSWRIEPRQSVSAFTKVFAPFVAVILTLIVGGALFSFLGYAPVETLFAFFVEPISSLYGLTELLVKAVPLIIIAIGLAIGFRGNVWNIGAEGQLIMGAVAATGVGLFVPEAFSNVLLILMFVAGLAGGIAWASIAAFLRTRLNTNEILVTLMLSYIAALILSWLVRGPWRDPGGFNFPQTAILPAAGMLDPINPSYRVTISVYFAVVALIAMWVFIARSFRGYKLEVGGTSPKAARYAGFGEKSAVWVGLLAGGGAAGLAGFFEVVGPLGQLSPVISPGYGFTAIIVAFIGRLHPVGILFGGLFLALTYVGGESVQVSYGIPSPITRVFQGVLLFLLLASEFFVSYRLVWRPRPS